MRHKSVYLNQTGLQLVIFYPARELQPNDARGHVQDADDNNKINIEKHAYRKHRLAEGPTRPFENSRFATSADRPRPRYREPGTQPGRWLLCILIGYCSCKRRDRERNRPFRVQWVHLAVIPNCV